MAEKPSESFNALDAAGRGWVISTSPPHRLRAGCTQAIKRSAGKNWGLFPKSMLELRSKGAVDKAACAVGPPCPGKAVPAGQELGVWHGGVECPAMNLQQSWAAGPYTAGWYSAKSMMQRPGWNKEGMRAWAIASGAPWLGLRRELDSQVRFLGVFCLFSSRGL